MSRKELLIPILWNNIALLWNNIISWVTLGKALADKKAAKVEKKKPVANPAEDSSSDDDSEEENVKVNNNKPMNGKAANGKAAPNKKKDETR